jgi:hypothetical protein
VTEPRFRCAQCQAEPGSRAWHGDHHTFIQYRWVHHYEQEKVIEVQVFCSDVCLFDWLALTKAPAQQVSA